MIISWLTNNVSAIIKQSIMFMTFARDIWLGLEKRFALTSGSRKYKLNKDLYELKQNNLSVTEYYTSIKSIWEELDSLNLLHVVTNPLTDVVKLFETIAEQKEETRLFRFLNGLDDHFNAQRSQILLMSPFPVLNLLVFLLSKRRPNKIF